MTTVSTTSQAASAGLSATVKGLNAPGSRPAGTSAMASLDQGDFMKLLIAQLQQQDPTAPVDNKDMLAQMAQFSALAGSTEANATLADISGKLDALIAAQTAANTAGQTPATQTPAS